MIFFNQKAYTLIELVIVVIIIGMLAQFGISSMYKAKERALLRQAVVELRMIKDAESAYMLKRSTYTTCTDKTQCGSYLGLDFTSTANLGTGATGGAVAAWNYNVTGTAPYCAYAVRTSGSYGGCTYMFCLDGSTTDSVYSSGSCP